MDWYARFFEELKSEENEVLFKKDTGSQITRYYVAGENEKKYFIVKKANNIEDNVCCSFDKECEGKLFKLVQE